MTTDWIWLTGLELWLKVGCTETERAHPQPVTMDIGINTCLKKAGRSDNLTDTVDYALVVDRLRGELTSGSFRLIETVAERAAQQVLDLHPGARVTVRVKKRALPGLAWAGVDITRQG